MELLHKSRTKQHAVANLAAADPERSGRWPPGGLLQGRRRSRLQVAQLPEAGSGQRASTAPRIHANTYPAAAGPTSSVDPQQLVTGAQQVASPGEAHPSAAGRASAGVLPDPHAGEKAAV
ncbi:MULTISPECIES: hypothetical protein [unclassified Paenibacillus]|uniref:hypothetical protein n=1 Tax=unclassified Paenibacillus TaxID=185978 RepID=UPI00110F77C6|nr:MULTISPECIES: hypothetical protein [unclassified Paenibacillus]